MFLFLVILFSMKLYALPGKLNYMKRVLLLVAE